MGARLRGAAMARARAHARAATQEFEVEAFDISFSVNFTPAAGAAPPLVVQPALRVKRDSNRFTGANACMLGLFWVQVAAPPCTRRSGGARVKLIGAARAAPGAGRVHLSFDNNYSMLRSKARGRGGLARPCSHGGRRVRRRCSTAYALLTRRRSLRRRR